MASAYPRSAEEAKEHIRQIRRDKGLGDDPGQLGNNAADLESALKVLSTDLYQTANHFLLELIQNADDNFYDVEEPTLAITYTPGRVRIDCNERGFAKNNVEAICRICKSTKSGRSKSTGFVGEKGIGFKAVFKVASTVWISSGHYSFKFNRDAHLGMIAPVWAEFPETKRPSVSTSIVLELAPDCNGKAVFNELRTYDSRILVFLRRLRRLEISADECPVRLGGFKKVLRRLSSSEADPRMMLLQNNTEKKKYLVWRHTATGMPKEERRPGIDSSEIVVAFPLGRNGDEPILEEQSVYAFLPVRDYGFKFLLQADFLLPANREDVISDSPWNKTLIQQAMVAFVDATHHMSGASNRLRYTWIRYIPTLPSQTPIFETFRTGTLERLRSIALLDSYAGEKHHPSELTMVPGDFCDQSGQPFVLTDSNKGNLLSPEYDEQDNEYLEALGVPKMSRVTFFAELGSATKAPERFFRGKTKQWHKSFAKNLIVMAGDHQPTLRQLPIIPLRGGTWADTGSGTIIFPTSESKLAAIPEGLNIRVVDPGAAADPDRRKLYASIGVEEYVDQKIINAITLRHADPHFKPDDFAAGIIVSHARFLFNLNWKNPLASHYSVAPSHDLWMESEDGKCRKGSAMYFPSATPGAASLILPNGRQSAAYGFLHPLYVDSDVKSGKGQFYLWLQQHMRVRLYPRLLKTSFTNYYTSDIKTHIHDDFKLIVQDHLSKQVLVLLREGWSYYGPFFDRSAGSHPGVNDTVIQGVKAYFQGLSVRTTGGINITSTFQPLRRLVEEANGLVPFLDIPDPENPNWTKLLGQLGVGSDTDLRFYLACLLGAKAKGDVPMSEVRGLVRNIEVKSASDLRQLREKFKGQSLVPVPSKDGKSVQWQALHECVWRGEAWLTQVVPLETYYPNNSALFRNYLNIPNSNVGHIIEEAALIKHGHTMAHIEKILLALASHAKVARPNLTQLERLKTTLRMFPVAVSSTTDKPYEYLATVGDTKQWLIADRAIFREQFRDILPILVLSVENVLKIREFLYLLDLKNRFLSERATTITEAHGNVELDGRLTDRYRSRGDFFFRLIPESQHDRNQLREKFRRVEVYTSSSVVQYWRANVGLDSVQSTQADGTAFLESDYAGDLRIYMRRGYELETHPVELATQLRLFFNIAPEHGDLVSAALTGSVQRLSELFESRGIAPLVDEEVPVPNLKSSEDEDLSNTWIPAYEPEENLPPPRESRPARLLRRIKFSPALSSAKTNRTTRVPLHGLGPAVARSTQGVHGQPGDTVRTAPSPFTMKSIKGIMKELEVVEKNGSLVGTPSQAPTLLDRAVSLVQTNAEIGEMIVSNILSTIFGVQWDEKVMWTGRHSKNANAATFTCEDGQGRFTSFLMRLEGISIRGQAYGNTIYHIDVKSTDKEDGQEFKLSQTEIDRFRQYSIQNASESDTSAPALASPWKNAAVLIRISNVRREPKIICLIDPWDLFHDGQLKVETSHTYKASLKIRPRAAGGVATGGFDSIQVRQRKKPFAGVAPDEGNEKEGAKGKELEKYWEKGRGGQSAAKAEARKPSELSKGSNSRAQSATAAADRGSGSLASGPSKPE